MNHNNGKGRCFFSVLALTAILPLGAQSPSFKQGQWMEIFNSVMRNVSRYYVDSLPVDKMYTDGISKMLSNLDPYTVYVPESGQDDFEMMITNTYGGMGAVIYKPELDGNVIINEPYEGSPAALAGLRCGDEITAIDGQSTHGLTVAQSSSRMKGKPGTEVVLDVVKVRSGEQVQLRIVRQKIHLPDIPYYGMLDGSTGYIQQVGFTAGVSEQLRDAVIDLKGRGMKRLVLDLRGNGGGLMDEAVKILSIFLPKGTNVVSSKGVDGEFHYTTPYDPVDIRLPLMVLVNSASASASEIVAGAVQDLDRGVIAGQRTFGKGLVQKLVPIAYNGQLKVTTSKYYTPSGRCVQAKDYSHRREDGSVGNIPDSLTREFKTLSGRIVRDGGGIAPDMKLEEKEYDRITYAVAYGGLTDNYPVEYCRSHESVADPGNFSMSDADYAAFVDWAVEQKFDSRSESETYYDMLVSQLKKDGEYEYAKESLTALAQVVKIDKRTALERSRSQIQPLLEQEIAIRYGFQRAGVQVALRYDDQLRSALQSWK